MVVGDALARLYEAFFGQNAAFSHCISRDDLRALIGDSIQDVGPAEEEGDEEDRRLVSSKDENFKANEIIRRLRTFGWIEIFEDPGTHREVYRFTRAGQLFAQELAEYNSPALRMTQRNVRNTKNSLHAYLEKGDAYELFIALDHSKNVVADLAHDIVDIHERRRQIISEAAHERAIDDFVAYMKGKFAPITSVKMRADSIYQHEREIRDLISKIKDQPPERLRALEAGARVFRATSTHEGSIVLQTLEQIIGNLTDAMRNKMAELSAAVSAYTDRTSFLALQASIVSGMSGLQSLSRALDAAASLEGEAQNEVLARLFARCVPFRIQLLDESAVKIRRGGARAIIETVHEEREPTREERLEAFIQEAESAAFAVSVKAIRAKLETWLTALNGSRTELLLSQIDVSSYDDLLMLTHAVESAYDPESGDLELACTPLGIRRSNAYLEFNDVAIRVVGRKKPSSRTHT